MGDPVTVPRHHRHRSARLPAAHVRCGELGAGGGREKAAADGIGYLPAADDLNQLMQGGLAANY
jgi:hypothetical protein